MGNDAEAKKTDSPRRLFRRWPFVFCLLLIQLVLLLNLNWMTSYNRTESGHIGAAVYFWKVRRFDIFCVNPPLARAICGQVKNRTLGITNITFMKRDDQPKTLDDVSSVWYAVSANDLYGTDTTSPFQGQKQTERIEASVFLYCVSRNDIKGNFEHE